MCVISEDKITLVIADNKIYNKNVSSFLGSSKIIKLGMGLNKNTIREFEKFLKRNATCGAEINVFVEGSEEALGVVIKKGSLFVPPSICRASKFAPVMPDCYRFTMSDDELLSI